MSEMTLLRQILLACSRGATRLFRNNVAGAWAGKVQRVQRSQLMLIGPNDVVIRDARPIRAGLCEGSSDLIGWKSITITQDMVGETVALFAAVEVKAPRGRLTLEQERFLGAVHEAGGLTLVARDVGTAEVLFGSSQKSLVSSQECCGNRITRG